MGAGRVLLASLPLLAALVLYLFPSLADRQESFTAQEYKVPSHVLDLFRSYDMNGDDLMDPYEFYDFVIQFPERGLMMPSQPDSIVGSFSEYEFQDEFLGPGQRVLLVEASMTPLDTKTMSLYSDGGPAQADKKLPGLLQWTRPVRPLREYGAGNFQVFYPSNQDLGQVYDVIPDGGERSGVSMYSYIPPKPQDNERLLHSLLSQLHTNPFVYTRFGPRGTKAVLRARSGELVDIVMRSHVEFQLNTSPNYPFWFTPAQLNGRLIVNTTSHQILYFQMSLPTDKQLNVDMEWLVGAAGANEVDIGFCSGLKLESVGAAYQFVSPGQEVSPQPVDLASLSWDSEIPLSEALSQLEQAFFPFKQVPYVPFLEALSEAVREGKLVHLIMLWGALDDQSC